MKRRPKPPESRNGVPIDLNVLNHRTLTLIHMELAGCPALPSPDRRRLLNWSVERFNYLVRCAADRDARQDEPDRDIFPGAD
jgi:hypothetical protein